MPRRPTGFMPKDVAASIHQRVLNLAYARGRPFNEVVQYYAMERVLAGIVHAGAADRFVLKGALALRTWEPSAARATRDIDLLAVAPDVGLMTTAVSPESGDTAHIRYALRLNATLGHRRLLTRAFPTGR